MKKIHSKIMLTSCILLLIILGLCMYNLIVSTSAFLDMKRSFEHATLKRFSESSFFAQFMSPVITDSISVVLSLVALLGNCFVLALLYGCEVTGEPKFAFVVKVRDKLESRRKKSVPQNQPEVETKHIDEG